VIRWWKATAIVGMGYSNFRTQIVVVKTNTIISTSILLLVSVQVNAAIFSTGIINGDWSLMSINAITGSPTQIGALGTSGVTAAGLAVMPISPIPIPIPAAVWLFGTGLLGLIGFSKRRKAA